MLFMRPDLKILFDGVFNHVGRGFWAFKDVQEKKWDSPYCGWFHLSFDGNTEYNDGFWYEGWKDITNLLSLNLDNPEGQTASVQMQSNSGQTFMALTVSALMLLTV